MSDLKKINDWRNVLRPWGERYADLVIEISHHCRSLSADELQILIEQTHRPDEGNCYWATYAIAPIVRDTARRVAYERSHSTTTGPGGADPKETRP